MHVFVTGGSRYIGRAVVADLVAAGHEVTGLMLRKPIGSKVS
jgi:nucleoside-diphosphate-sugar epimerase